MCVQTTSREQLEPRTAKKVNSFRRQTNANSHATESKYLVIPISSVKTKHFNKLALLLTSMLLTVLLHGLRK